MTRFFTAITCVILLLGCKKEGELFENPSPSKTSITFSNDIVETEELNILDYLYFYNGGGVAIGDINNDGLSDIYLTANTEKNKLYLNKGNMVFEDISEKAGVEGNKPWSTGVVMVDVNADGLLDIYVSNAGNMEGENHNNDLYINNGDLTFTEMAKEYNLAETGFTTHASFFDYDLDGDLDLYVANYPPTRFNAPNFYYAFKQKFPKPLETDRLFKNEDGIFIDVTEEAGLKTFGLSLSATVGDLNQDGWPGCYKTVDTAEKHFSRSSVFCQLPPHDRV